VIQFFRVTGFCALILVGAAINALLLLLLIDILSADFLKKQQALMQPCGVGQAYDSKTGQVCPRETK
jgi:hypothetical protein